MFEPKENKALEPDLTPDPSPKGEGGRGVRKVKVKIRQNREIAGVGKAGDVVEMTEADARQYEREGYVTILKK